MAKASLDPIDLGTFEGRPVRSQVVKVVKTGDGLSEAIAVTPVEMHMGEEVYFAVRGTVTRVGYEIVNDKGEDTGFARRVITVAASMVAPVKAQAVRKALTDTQKAIEAARGVVALPGMDEGDESE
jgi:hypothetical protein